MNVQPVISLGLMVGIAVLSPATSANDVASTLHIKVVAATCSNCHGPAGKSLGSVPSLSGKDKAYLLEAMKEQKSGVRETTVMRKYMLGYTDAEMAQLADYFSRPEQQDAKLTRSEP